MALSADFEAFSNRTLQTLITGIFPDNYPTQYSFNLHIASRSRTDIYFLKLACDNYLAQNSHHLEGILGWALTHYKEQAARNDAFKRRVSFLLPTLEEARQNYEEEMRFDKGSSEAIARFELNRKLAKYNK